MYCHFLDGNLLRKYIEIKYFFVKGPDSTT